jgi:hypothetical protein
MPGKGFTHDVYVDRASIGWVTGEDGTFGFDGSDPAHPRLVYRSDEAVKNSGHSGPDSPDTAQTYPLDFLHHNSIRTSIQLAPLPVAQSQPAAPVHAPTKPAAKKPAQKAKKKHKASKHKQKATKKHKAKQKKRKTKTRRHRTRTTLGGLGDVMAITEEDYTRPTCNGQGSLQTWQITDERNSDGTIKLKLLDMWTTELDELSRLEGRSPATALCSAHWFDEDGGLLAQGWYDQGVRFLDISSPKDIRQVGYWATTGTFWAAYFAPTDPKRETVYGLDVTGGIDVLHIDRSTHMRAVRAPVAQRWLKPAASLRVPSPKWGYVCPLLLNQLTAPASASSAGRDT